MSQNILHPLQESPHHPYDGAGGDHEIDRNLEPLQHDERCDGHNQGENVEPLKREAVGEQDLRGEVHSEVGDHTNDRSRNAHSDGPDPLVVGQEFYVRGGQEDEQETRQERRVGGGQSPQSPVKQGGEGDGVVVRPDKPDVLGDHDERPRRGLGEPQSLHHLVGREPPVMVDRYVRYVAQNRVRAAEGDEGCPRKEEGFPEEHVLPTTPDPHGTDRHRPEHQKRTKEPQVTQHRGLATGFDPVYRRLFLLRGAVPAALEGFRHRAAQEKPTDGGGEHHEWEGNRQEIQGDERSDREAYEQVVVEGTLGDPQDSLHDDGYHDRLDPVEEPRDRRHVRVGYGQVREEP